MVTTIIFVIGVLFIANGITSMNNSRVIRQVRSQMPSDCEIYFGGSKGLLCLSSTDAMFAVRKDGNIAKAYCIKSGWLRRSKSEELHFDEKKMEKLSMHLDHLEDAEKKACSMALHQYMRRK